MRSTRWAPCTARKPAEKAQDSSPGHRSTRGRETGLRNLDLTYRCATSSSPPHRALEAWVNADHAAESITHKSMTGVVITLDGSAIH